MNEQYVSALADVYLPQRCAGCNGLSSGLPCRECSEALPRAGRPVCARCGMPTAFEAFVCGACKGLDFGFESARVSLRYESVGEEIVPALKYRGSTTSVFTTGATMSSCTETLLRGEVQEEVYAVSLCRTE